jgi:AcrR family transcriptional regulator
MLDTKQKIIQAAAALFHEYGVASVRLQQIADRAEVSVGNLAYHFKNKEAIILAVYEQLGQEATGILQQFRQLPTLLDLDNQLTSWFAFQHDYSFYFVSLLPEPVTAAAQSRATLLSRLVSQLTKRLEYHAQRLTIQPASEEAPYPTIAEAVALTITHWPRYRNVRGQFAADERAFKQLVWLQLYPYLTARGRTEYQALIQPILSPSS